jgi:hypothetical protein
MSLLPLEMLHRLSVKVVLYPSLVSCLTDSNEMWNYGTKYASILSSLRYIVPLLFDLTEWSSPIVISRLLFIRLSSRRLLLQKW